MSDEAEKGPFCCTFSGCEQNFSNVDRLNVHLELHKSEGEGESEDLRLKMTRNEQMIDQTPTPTRFLRVCDAEGLFQDMPKSSNPFDEGFKAGLNKSSQESTSQFSGVETLAAVAVASAAASPSHSDDDLRPSENVAAANTNSSATTAAAATAASSYSLNQVNRLTGPFMNGDVVVPVPPPASLANPESSVPMAIPPTSFLPKGASTSGGVPSSVRSAPKAPASIAPVTPDTKKRLQETLSRLHPTAVSVSDQVALSAAVTAANNVMQSDGMAPLAAMDPASTSSDPEDADTHTITISLDNSHHMVSDMDDSYSSLDGSLKSTPNGKRRRLSEDLDPVEKRARFLQRNREAATRCREKRKEWIATLERRSQDLARQNAQLQAEVTALRNERAHLKVLLLGHKDCPVTVQQQKNMQVPPSLLPLVNAVSNAGVGTAGSGVEGDATADAAADASSGAGSTAVAAAAGAGSVAGSSSQQPVPLGMPSIVMPMTSSNAIADASGTPKGAVTLALPAPISIAGAAGAQGVGSPMPTPLLMFPLTADHLQMAAAASTGTNIDFNSMQLFQHLQQLQRGTAAQMAAAQVVAVGSPPRVAGTGGVGAVPTTPSTAAIQALLGSAQLAMLQAAIQQQQQQQQAMQQPQAMDTTPQAGDATVVEAAPGVPVVEEIHEVELS